MIARGVVLAGAIAGIVLLAGELGVARDIDRAAALSQEGPSGTTEALALLRRAASRTADTTPLLREAQLLLFRRRPAEALGPAHEAVRREPDNALAWQLVGQSAERAGDAARARAARARVSALVARP
jgi:predicted Zn-dependent protease